MPTATAPARRRTRELDSLTGLSAIDAIARVRSLELRPAIEPCDGGPGDHGRVLAQEPAAGTELSRGQLVTLIVGECGAPGDSPAAEQVPAQRPTEPRALKALPKPSLELPAPSPTRPAVPNVHAIGTDSRPLIPVHSASVLRPAPVPAPVPVPERGHERAPEPEHEHDPEQGPGPEQGPDPEPLHPQPGTSTPDGAGGSRPTVGQTRERPGHRPRRRLLAVALAGILSVGAGAMAGVQLPRLTGSATHSSAPQALASDRGNHRRISRRHSATAIHRHRPTARSEPMARQRTVGTLVAAGDAASRAGQPQPRPVIAAGGPPVRAPAASPDPVSPIGPVPGPPPSQTGGTP